MVRYKLILLLLLFSLNISAQNFNLKVVADASKGKNDDSKVYTIWKTTSSPYFINIKSKNIETYEHRDFINVVKIMRQQKLTKNRNGDDLFRYDCK